MITHDLDDDDVMPSKPLWERRLAARAGITGLRRLKIDVPQQLQDFADGLVDDPGPVMEVAEQALAAGRRRPWWRRLLGA